MCKAVTIREWNKCNAFVFTIKIELYAQVFIDSAVQEFDHFDFGIFLWLVNDVMCKAVTICELVNITFISLANGYCYAHRIIHQS